MNQNLFLPNVYINPAIKQEVDNFIDKVFTYYNGRINPNNRLLLINKLWHNQIKLFSNNEKMHDGEHNGPIINIYPTELLINCASYLDNNDRASIDNWHFMNQVHCDIIATIYST